MRKTSAAFKEILGDNDFVYLDIGARGGPKKELRELLEDNVIKIILVELEEKEARKLKKKNFVVCHKAIWKEKIVKKIYITRNKSYSSLLLPNENVLKGTLYHDRDFYKVDKIVTLKTTTIKDILKNNSESVHQIDFIKIDIQGAEGYLFETMEKEIWENLIGCETEAYTNELYHESITLDKLITKFYIKDFEIYKIKNISSMIMTSFDDIKIYNELYFPAIPKSRYYNGKDLVYDILFLKKIFSIIKSKDSSKARKLIFILTIYKYYDFAFFLLLKIKHEKIINQIEFNIINQNLKKIISLKTPFWWRLKQKFKLRKYKIDKR
jgi:FkbM family methyltransferase